MTRYTVYHPTTGTEYGRGLTALQAMRAILTHDGYAYKFVRRRDGRLELWHSDGSCNSPRGAGHFTRTVAVSHAPGLEGQREIAMQVIQADWPGLPEAMSDAAYDAMIAEAAEDA